MEVRMDMSEKSGEREREEFDKEERDNRTCCSCGSHFRALMQQDRPWNAKVFTLFFIFAAL